MKTIGWLLFLSFLMVESFSGCVGLYKKHDPEKKPLKDQGITTTPIMESVDQIKVYCWCFVLFPYQWKKENGTSRMYDYMGREVDDLYSCQTPIGLKTKDLSKEAYNRVNILEKGTIQVIQNSLLTHYERKEYYPHGGDLRLVFSFESKSHQKSLSLGYVDEQSMLINDSILLHYPFRVDSFLLKHVPDFEFICPD